MVKFKEGASGLNIWFPNADVPDANALFPGLRFGCGVEFSLCLC